MNEKPEKNLVSRSSFIIGAIACILSFTNMPEVFFVLVLPLPPIAVLLGIIGLIISIKYKSGEEVYAILGIISGILPILRFFSFIADVRSISG